MKVSAPDESDLGDIASLEHTDGSYEIADQLTLTRNTPASSTRLGEPTSQASLSNQQLILIVGGVITVVLLLGIIVIAMSGGGGDNQDRQPAVAVVDQPAPSPVIRSAPRSKAVAPGRESKGSSNSTPDSSSRIRSIPVPRSGSLPGAGSTPVAVGPSFNTRPTSYRSSANVVSRAKKATVYIKAIGPKVASTGTGFVVATSGNRVIVATNRHVVYPHVDVDRGESIAGAPKAQLGVVFRSGTPDQEERRATLLYADPSPDRDLAILEVNGVRDVPDPIDPFDHSQVSELTAVVIYGFPFGRQLEVSNTSARNPSITVNRGSISGFRYDDQGQLNLIQIDGSINSGNSGGPILDQQGKLVGVAVAKIANTTIGFAIAPVLLEQILRGRFESATIRVTDVQTSIRTIDVEANLINPIAKLRSVSLLTSDSTVNASQPRPDSFGVYPRLVDAKRTSLTMDGPDRARGRLMLLNRPASGSMQVQFEMTDDEGRVSRSRPMTYQVPADSEPGATVVLGRPKSDTSRPGSRPRSEDGFPITFDKLGPLILANKENPKEEGCDYEQDGPRLTITAPRDEPHLLIPKISTVNAPMCLTEEPVDDDFIAMVTVVGTIQPGNRPLRHPQRRRENLFFAFASAGLILWQDEQNFVRIERAARGWPNDLNKEHYLLVEAVQDGDYAGHEYINIPDQLAKLRAIRYEGAFYLQYSPDSRVWWAFPELSVLLNDEIRVGLCVNNASKRDFKGHFEDFTLLTKEEVLDQIQEGILEIKPDEEAESESNRSNGQSSGRGSETNRGGGGRGSSPDQEERSGGQRGTQGGYNPTSAYLRSSN